MNKEKVQKMHPAAMAAIVTTASLAFVGLLGGVLYEVVNYATTPLRGVPCNRLPYNTKFMKRGDQIIGLESDVMQKEESGERWILIFTPNGADSVEMFNKHAETWKRHNLHVAIFDFPGTGLRWEEAKKNWRPSDKQVEDDVQSAFDSWSKNHPKARFVVFGTSLGSFSATVLANYISKKRTELIKNGQCRGLVLAMPIHSLSRATKNVSGVGQFLLCAKLETFKQAKEVKGIPVGIFAGTNDGFTRLTDLQELIDSFPEKSKVQVRTFKGVGHEIFLDNPVDVLNHVLFLMGRGP